METVSDSKPQLGDAAKKRICIIGAGPAGLGALKVIADAPQYKQGLWEPVAFEAREAIGGVWLPAPAAGDPPRTPLYDSLTTNVPHPFMAYPSFSFPPETPLYPPASTVLQYLNSYATHFDTRKHVRVNTTVRFVDWDAALSRWRVRTSATGAPPDDAGEEALFDLVIVANGHYNQPYIPPTPGLASWIAGGKATHVAWYRHARHVGDTVLVVGAGYSGQDVVAEMRAVCATLIHSYSSAACAAAAVTGAGAVVQPRPRVAEYLDPTEGRVRFEDGSTAAGVDHCFLATGYEHALPFLSRGIMEPGPPPPTAAVPAPRLYNSAHHVFPLAMHLFPLTTAFPPTRMCFLALPYYTTPLALAEAHTRAALAAFADPTALDVAREAAALAAHRARLRAAAGDDERAVARRWHWMDEEQFAYRDALHAFAGAAGLGVPAWVVEVYRTRDVLRAAWRELVRTGEDGEWVRGVGRAGGEEGQQQWVDMMGRLVRWAEARAKLPEAWASSKL